VVGSRHAADRAEATEALTAGRQRAGGQAPVGQPAMIALQRRAGNEAVNALLSAKIRLPAAGAVADIDSALQELRHDEPSVEPVEKGLRAAKAAGVPVDLEGPKPPAGALTVTRTGFGPASVPPKKPALPTKPVPPKSPLARFVGKPARPPGTQPVGDATTAPATGGSAGTSVSAPPVGGTVDPMASPVSPALVRPDDDPAFSQVKQQVGAVGKATRVHPPAAVKAKEAQDAALPPVDDLGAQAKAAKVDTMDAQQPGTFDKAAFIAAVKTAIEAKSPKTLKEADAYKESGKAGEVKGEVHGLVTQGKEGQTKDVETATTAPPDQSKAVPKPVAPMAPEQPGVTTSVPATGAAPKPAPNDQLNLAAGPRAADAEMAEADVTDDQLARSNEPEFTQAAGDKKAAAEHSAQAPAQYRQQESQVIQQGRVEANTEAAEGTASMQGSKGAALAKLVADKGKAKTKDEAKRGEVTGKIQSIFAATETDVKKILDGIDPQVETAFTTGEAAARQSFEAYVSAKMSAYKKDRYGGWLGGLRWAKDKLLGMPDKVNEFYEAGREIYLKQMSGVISRVADIVGDSLTAAKRRIATGKAEIAVYVKGLPADLKKVGSEASREIGERFADLESEVDAKQESVVDTLATKYVEARKGLDERIEALQAENKGLVDKAIGAIKAVINTIRELAAMLKNVLARAAGVVSQIIKDPIGFLGNLIAGIKGGILKFKDNILGHLRKGLMGWLFGSLAEAGIELPDSFDLKGIIKLLASIFGLTWANIRTRIVKQIGEKAMGAVEKGVEIFSIFASQGIGGLWHMLVEKLGDIKEMILEQVKDFVITKIITAGITWLIGLLNPAAAFIKACKLIYDVVMFFVTNGSRIMAFVNTILDSVGEIVRGNVGAVVNKINDVLGQMIPLIIGFLASAIGLGGIGQKIREIITKLQKPINTALDFVIKKGLQLAGPVIRGLKGIGSRVKAKVASGKAWVKGKAEAGKAWVKDKAAAGSAWAGQKLRGAAARISPPSDQPDAAHRLQAAVSAAGRLMQAPDATTASVRSGLPTIRERFRLASIDFVNPRGHDWQVVAHINPDLPSDSRKLPSPDERAAINAQSERIAALWRVNGMADQFRAEGRAGQRQLLLDPESYARPANRPNAPDVKVGDLVEAMAEPGLRRVAEQTGTTLLVRPELYFMDAAGGLIGGRIDELDFMLIGPAEVRVVSAKTNRRQFALPVDQAKLDMIRQVPDNPGAFDFVRNWMGWGQGARERDRVATATLGVRFNGGTVVRVGAFRGRYLSHEQTRSIVIEPVHPKHQGENPATGHQLRLDLPDLIELYILELKRRL
jgi:hypothetical protein